MSGPDRVGVLGGMFDPIHHGHLDAAEAVRDVLQLDEVLLMPSRVAPHRPTVPHASTYHRFAMVALATVGRSGLLASDVELQRLGPSYTAVTLRGLTAAGRDPWQMFFITGADAFAEIASWHDYPALLEAGQFAVVSRPRFPAAGLRRQLPDLSSYMRDAPVTPTVAASAGAVAPRKLPSIWLIDATTRDVSSTDIRRRLASNLPLAGLVPPAVETYIRQHRLYLPGSAADRLHE